MSVINPTAAIEAFFGALSKELEEAMLKNDASAIVLTLQKAKLFEKRKDSGIALARKCFGFKKTHAKNILDVESVNAFIIDYMLLKLTEGTKAFNERVAKISDELKTKALEEEAEKAEEKFKEQVQKSCSQIVETIQETKARFLVHEPWLADTFINLEGVIPANVSKVLNEILQSSEPFKGDLSIAVDKFCKEIAGVADSGVLMKIAGKLSTCSAEEFKGLLPPPPEKKPTGAKSAAPRKSATHHADAKPAGVPASLPPPPSADAKPADIPRPPPPQKVKAAGAKTADVPSSTSTEATGTVDNASISPKMAFALFKKQHGE